MAKNKLQPNHRTWLNILCRNFVNRVKVVPEVVMVAVQPYNESGLPDFFVLLEDDAPAAQSLARYQVTQAVLNLRWQYANPWLLDYYFLNLAEDRESNVAISWRDFINEGETIIYVRDNQPFDMRIARWAGAAAGMFGCAALLLFITVTSRTNPGNILNLGLQSILFLLPLLLIAGGLASACTLSSFRRANIWSNGEGVSNAWSQAMTESGLVVGATISLVVVLPGVIGLQTDFLATFSNLSNARATFGWQLPPPLNIWAYLNPTTLLYVFSGLVLGLLTAFGISLTTSWLVRRWVISHPLQATTPYNESRLSISLKYLSLALTFAALYFACYALWPVQSYFSAN